MREDWLYWRAVDHIKQRKERIRRGFVNCLPSPFPAFRGFFPGLEQASYYGITAGTKAAKSQFMNFLLFNALEYCYDNPDQVDIHVPYFAMEESETNIMLRFISYMLYKKRGMRCDSRKLKSVSEELDDKIVELLETDKEVIAMGEFFSRHVTVYTSDSLSLIEEKLEEYAKENGTEVFADKKDFDPSDIDCLCDRGEVVGYIPNDKNRYTIVVLDHMGLLTPETGEIERMAIKRMSASLAKKWRNIYGFTILAIIQQVFDDGAERGRASHTEPTVSGLADAKTVARDFNMLLSLYSPYFYGKTEYSCGRDEVYDISILRDNFRLLKILLNRDGMALHMHPLYFDGAVCFFESMPKASDKERMDMIYRRLVDIGNLRQ